MAQALLVGAAAAAGLVALMKHALRPLNLHDAAKRNHVSALEELLHKGHDPARKNDFGQTPLHIAASLGNVCIIKQLLEYRPQLAYIQNDRGETALMVAVYSECPNAAHILAQYNKSEIERALSQSMNIDVIRALLHVLPDKGENMLRMAALNGDDKKLMKLLSSGVSPNAKDYSELTPLHHAATMGQMNCILALIEFQAYMNERDKKGDTPLHKAVKSNHVKAAAALVNAGADREAKNGNMQTPYELAHTKTMYEVVKPSQCSIM